MAQRTPAWLRELVTASRPGYTLPQPFYNDPRIFELDTERIFMKYWLFVGHESLIPDPGDYFLYSIAGESIIVVRDAEGQVQAMYNVCRHRGSRVCHEERGQVKSFVCPYHGWTYAGDGALLAAKRMPPDFEKSEWGLHKCHVEQVQGLVYISLAEHPKDFTHFRDDMNAAFTPHGLADAKIAHQMTWRVSANWKLVWENFQECYHCAHAHPEYCQVQPEGVARSTESAEVRAAFDELVSNWLEADQKRRRKTHVHPITADTLYGAVRTPFKPGYRSQSPSGALMAPLMGEMTELEGGMTCMAARPGHAVNACPDHVCTFRFTPLAPDDTEVEITWLVAPRAVEDRDFQLDELTWLWHKTTDQDAQIVTDNQKGVNSRRYVPGPYSEAESGPQEIVAWYLRHFE